MAAAAGRAVLVIDLKEAELEDRIAALLTVAPRSLEVWVWTSDLLTAYQARQALPGLVPVSLIARPETVTQRGTGEVIEEVRTCRLDGIVFEACQMSAYRADVARAAGLDVHAGTSNTPLELATAEVAGVSAVCTDFPSVAARVIGGGQRTATPRPPRLLTARSERDHSLAAEFESASATKGAVE
jgi:glycerophosphoryl diester phosphodiesterase